MNGSQRLKIDPDPDARLVFLLDVVVQIKALACQLSFEKAFPSPVTEMAIMFTLACTLPDS